MPRAAAPPRAPNSPSILRLAAFPLALVAIIGSSVGLYRSVLEKRSQDQRARRKEYPNPI